MASSSIIVLDSFVHRQIWDDKTIVEILYKNEHPVVPDLKSFKSDKSSEFGVFNVRFKDLLCYRGLKTMKISGTIYSVQLDADYIKGLNEIDCDRKERGRRGFCYNSSYSGLCVTCYGHSDAKLSNLHAYALKKESDNDFILPTNKAERVKIELTEPTIDDVKRRFDEISPQISKCLLTLTQDERKSHDEINQIDLLTSKLIHLGFDVNDPISDMKQQMSDYDILLQNIGINEKQQQHVSVSKQQFWNKEVDIIELKIAKLQAEILYLQKDKQEIFQKKAKISLDSKLDNPQELNICSKLLCGLKL